MWVESADKPGKATLHVRLQPTTPRALQSIKVGSGSSRTQAIEGGVVIESKAQALESAVGVLTACLGRARQAVGS
jgi:hypothetical protein